MAAYTAIDDAGLFFSPTLYTGNLSTNAITGVGFQPDFVWIKSYSNVDSSSLFDAVRGVHIRLASNSTAAQTTSTTSLTAFDSDGFTLGDNDRANADTETYVSWNWKGGTTAVPSSGSITPSGVSFSAASGFGVYEWTGTGATGTIAHGLGAAPQMLLVKNTAIVSGWQVSSVKIGFTKVAYLNTNAAPDTSSTVWNNTAPSSTLITVGSNNGTNKSGDVIICYALANVQGFSKFGSYVGNGVTGNGPFVYTGFRPAWLLIKRFDSTGDWLMYDSKRGYNSDNAYLKANGTNVEQTDVDIDLLSNGFKCLGGGDQNTSAGTHLYAAFAESPFVNSEGVPTNAR